MFFTRSLLKFVFSLFGWWFFSTLQAQEKMQVQIIPVDSVAKRILDTKSLKFKTTDSLSVINKLRKFSKDWKKKGYLTSNFDSICFDSLSVRAFFFLGKKLSLANLNLNQVPEEILRKSGVQRKVLKGKKIDYWEFIKLRETIVEYYENSGYPFAQVQIESALVRNDGVNGKLIIKKNAFIEIDSIIVKGKPKIAGKYLNHCISIKKGESYNQKKINELSKSFDELTYLEELKPVEVEFRENKADIYLYLKNKQANYFNGIIGFASGTEENPDFQVTGDLSLSLVNAFKIGEEIKIYWDKYSVNSQNLKLGFLFPYLFFLPIGVDFRFELEKYELDYLNINFFGGASYAIPPNNSVQVYFTKRNSYLIDNNEESPSNINESAHFTAGVSFYIEQTDYRLNPRKGFLMEASSGYGNRTSDGISSNFVDFNLEFASFFKLGEIGTLALLNTSAGMISEVGFYENELFRIGGNNSLRGVDEQSILASSYSILSVEPRVLIGKNSAIYLFGDMAWYELKGVDNQVSDTPFGFGLGLNIDTKAGVFKLSYAMGKQFNNPIKFSDSKVHFGFSARF